MTHHTTAEDGRLAQCCAEGAEGSADWKRWGPYLSERQWGTVREDYSGDGNCWESFPHDHARSRAYRWGEDGLLGICDEQCRLCFALALWNGKDPILKERLFGLTGLEGNHGEDVKEEYFYLDSTPTHSFMRASYVYPIEAYPYERLVRENRLRTRYEPEFELRDTGVLDAGHWDVEVQYAKASPEDILIRVHVRNVSDRSSTLHVLPTLWFRNTWSWSGGEERAVPRLHARKGDEGRIVAQHASLGDYELLIDEASDNTPAQLLFTNNETNAQRLWRAEQSPRFAKDAFHECVVRGVRDAVNPAREGTKACAWFELGVPAHAGVTLRLRLRRTAGREAHPSGKAAVSRRTALASADFDALLEARGREADAFYAARGHAGLSREEGLVARRAAAGLMWSKQFYEYDVRRWLDGDPAQPPPPGERRAGRNHGWEHLNNRDVLLMPDKWEYPWYAAWDLAFHCVAAAPLDARLAKDQLVLMLREWYMHPSGQMPAYEFALGDVNPPVHAWAVWRVYQMSGGAGHRDRVFLARCFQKLLVNFTWWVNRKDPSGRNLFSGGFLGLDNIGVFDRSQPLPTGGHLEQADGTAWMAFYCGTMLSMALELAKGDPAYEDIATKFFEHFIAITDAINTVGGAGLWDEQDGFYYDQVRLPEGRSMPLRVRSLVGMVPLLAVELLDDETISGLPDFKRRMDWFLAHRRDLSWHETCACAHAPPGSADGRGSRLLAIPTMRRLQRVVQLLMDEREFLSPFGVRSLSRYHEAHPFVLHAGGREHRVDYAPGESTSGIFGGNSNWRGPIWFPLNFLLIEALERYHSFYGSRVQVELPGAAPGCATGTLADAAEIIRGRLVSLFLPDATGRRPCMGEDARAAADPARRDLLLFHEHFHAETGRGLGASHQTGWTALVGLLLGHRRQPGAATAQNTPLAPSAPGHMSG